MNEKIFQKVKDLNLPIGKYIIFGSGPLAIRNLKIPHDIDILVTQDVYDRYKQKNEWQEKEYNQDLYLENDENIELWCNWRPGEWNIQKLINEAEIIDDLPFVKLEYVLKWKKQNGRPKDLEDIKKIEDKINN